MTLVEFEFRQRTNIILGKVDGWTSIVDKEGILLGFNYGHETLLRLPDYTESDVAFLRVQRKLPREYILKYFGQMTELGNVSYQTDGYYLFDCMCLPLDIRAKALAKTFQEIETAAMMERIGHV